MDKTIVVIGGGPAGMLSAGIAAKNGNRVILLEKNEKLGKKLYITGKGRCNLTNASEPEILLENTIGNPYFLYSAYYSFDSSSLMAFFEELGVKLKIERGRRVFPKSDKSSDVIKALTTFLNANNVDIRLNTRAESFCFGTDRSIRQIVTNKGAIESDAVVIATGGLSYPSTGSTGDGYKLAKSAGHNITKLYPSLVPLKTEEQWVSRLQGLSLKNAAVKVLVDNKTVYENFGEMLFTHFGITGPVVLSASRYIIKSLADGKKPVFIIDLKPALNEAELDRRVLRDFEKYKNKAFKNSLDDLFPQKLIPIIVELSDIDGNKKVNEVTKNERKALVGLIKALKLTIFDTTGFSQAVITSGGIDTNEIEPSSMKSKLCNNLFFAGEVIDVDALTGGFNLQIAFSTGYTAGCNT